ncbi:MAG: hypothetical protein ABI689_07340 [Thermoanaerobaculia bacterium]
MRILKLVVASAVLACAAVPPASAGVYSDALAKCLVASTTPRDQTDLVRWIFATAALHPGVSSIAAVSAEQRTAMARTVAELFERLLTESCRSQFSAAMQNEGNQTIEAAFQVLGQVAMRALMADPAVGKGFDEIDTFLHKEKIEAAAKPVAPTAVAP